MDGVASYFQFNPDDHVAATQCSRLVPEATNCCGSLMTYPRSLCRAPADLFIASHASIFGQMLPVHLSTSRWIAIVWFRDPQASNWSSREIRLVHFRWIIELL